MLKKPSIRANFAQKLFSLFGVGKTFQYDIFTKLHAFHLKPYDISTLVGIH